MFADDTNLFCSHHDIKTLRDTVNNELSKLTYLQIASESIKRTFSMKFLGVMLDENIRWKDHIRAKKIAKNLSLPYCTKQLQNEQSLKIIYFSYINSSLNYANVA